MTLRRVVVSLVWLITASVFGWLYYRGTRPTAISALESQTRSELSRPAERKSSAKENQVDLGIVLAGTTKSHVFQVTNTSQAEWTVERTEVTCGCTVVDVKDNVAQPGECLRVEVQYRASSQSSTEKKDVFVHLTNGSVIRLRIAATVRTPIYCIPTIVPLGSVAAGQSVVGKFEVANFSAIEWGQVKLTGPDDLRLTASYRKNKTCPKGAVESWEIEFSIIAPDHKERSSFHGDWNPQLRLVAMGVDQQQTEFDAVVPITANVTYPLVAIPSRCVFGVLEPGSEGRHERVLLRFADSCYPSDVNRLKVEHDLGPSLHFEIHPQKSPFVELELWFDAKLATAGPLSGMIRVTAPGVPETLEIPVLAEVRGKP